jgi:hypothetical protein
MELEAGNGRKRRSTTIKPDLWIKNTQKTQQIWRSNFELFFGVKFLGIFLGQNWRDSRVKFVETFALIPYDGA